METFEKQIYYEDDKENGLVINWDKIDKEFRKLKVPSHVYQADVPWNDAKIFVLMSKRGTGKTTSFLLKGMLAYCLYGVRIEWIRQTYDMIKPTNTKEMFNTIRQYDYISKITRGKFNDVIYKERAYYFCKYTGNPKPDEVDTTPFLHFLTIDQERDIRSNYTSPLGDLIVLDEYQIRCPRLENEFNSFFNIVSTLRRLRRSPRVFFLGNTTSPYNHYYHELDITKIILKMKPSDRALYTTRRGAKIYIEWVDPKHQDKKKNEERRILDNEYFGFEGLNSIVGDGWDIPNYPHITRKIDEEKEVEEIFYLHTQIFNMELKLCFHDEIGHFVFVRPVNNYNMKDEVPTFTDADIDSPWKIRGIGRTIPACREFWHLFDQGRFLYTTNDIGELVTSYVLKWKLL